jgi:NAD(P)H dehydrogenase (quinone)
VTIEKAMSISVILAHPTPGSFNHAIARAAASVLKRKGFVVHFHDLYREKFDPVLPADEIAKEAKVPRIIKKHCDEIAAAEGIVIIHPNWWGQPPAMLTGWIDRVMRPGVAYEFLENDGGEGVPRGLLKAKAAVIINTSNTPRQREQKVFRDPLQSIWMNCVFTLCGVSKVYRKNFGVVISSTPERRKAWLAHVRQMVIGAFVKRRNLSQN